MDLSKFLVSTSVINVDLSNWKGEGSDLIYPSGRFSLQESGAFSLSASRKLSTEKIRGAVGEYEFLQDPGAAADTYRIQLAVDETRSICFTIKSKKPVELLAAVDSVRAQPSQDKAPDDDEAADDERQTEIAPSLHKKLQKALSEALIPGETVMFVAKGASKQAMVATNNRILVLKLGMMSGNTFGSNITSFYPEDITAVELQKKKLAVSYLIIRAPGFSTNAVHMFGDNNEQNDVYKLPNMIPVDAEEGQKFVSNFHQWKVGIKQEGDALTPPPSVAGSDLTNKIEKLVAMKEAGHIDEEEFKAMKTRILEEG